MRTFTVAARRARLARRHQLAGGLAPVSAETLTGTLVGLHATDPATPYLSLWARVPGCSVDAVRAALYDDRTLVKHLAMRRTLWVVRPEDLPSVQSAASDRV
ncbi:DNA glycosylase AlkZ-like family protein, partial [Mycolicibacterium hippocampi]|uniref:DNA glycosylase AlkZ-like family protein n=1 Tax=Mycolicibacterium hippocampi TaxID=659824 RepID=UPI003515765E